MNHSTELKVTKFEAPQSLKAATYASLVIGLISFVLGFIKNPERMWTSYLTAFFFFAGLASCALFFIAFSYASKAGWNVTIRRYAEAMTNFFPVMLVASLVLIVGFKFLYAWAVPETMENLHSAKQIFLAPWFVVLRMVIFGLGCIYFGKLIVGNSLKQDQNGNPELTNQNLRYSIGYIAFFSISFSLLCIDLLMSLLPTWYSTIYGIYCFAGALQAMFALLAIIIVCMKNSPWVSGYVNDEHQHDVGKFLKGFSVFWAYISFSQFMLIWYANIPEETEFYITRSLNGWMSISFALLIFRFMVPFLVLLPRGSKRSNSVLVFTSVLVLVMHYIDVYWLVYPNFFDGEPRFGFWEIGIFLGFAGLFSMTMIQFLSKHSLVPLKDPRLHEAMAHHVTY